MIARIHRNIQALILNILDFFYPIFRNWMPVQTYRYAASGGGNLALSVLVYFISFQYILQKELVELPFIAISAHIASLIIAFLVTFPIGFYLNYAVVFNGSYLRKRTQLFRYLMVVFACLILNYVLMKIFVEYWHWYPTPSYIFTQVFVTAFSYLSQRFFTFKKK